MTTRVGIGSLLAAVFRGLRARASLTVGSAVLTAVAVASAVLGPAYQASASQSFLVARLGEASPDTSGVSVTYRPAADQGGDVQGAYARARRVGRERLADLFGPASLSLESAHDSVEHVFGLHYDGFAVLRSKQGACQHLQVTGDCPSKPGQAMMLAADASAIHLQVGDTVRFSGYPGPVRVVGLYVVPDHASDFWFDDSRLTTIPPTPTRSGTTVFKPAPLVVARSTFDALPGGSWKVDIDHFLTVDADITPDDVRRARQVAVALPKDLRSADDGRYHVSRDNGLQYLLPEIDRNRVIARKTVTPAVVSLVLVALALLVRLLGAAADQRRNELALASLRGMNRRQMWTFGLAEPVTLLLLATPVGIALGYGAAVGLSRIWLIDGVDVDVGRWSVLAAAVVLAAAILASVVTVARAFGEPLSSRLVGVRRPGRSGRWAMIAKMVLVIAAVAVVASSLTEKGRSEPGTTDLVLPLLLATAAGLLITAGTVVVARWSARRTSRRRGITGFVAARAVSRRREASLVILPLTAALAISVFAGGVFGAASAWRASTAATVVGADQAYRSPRTMSETVADTHRIDPHGRWLMAAGVDTQADYGEKLVLDTPRLGRVGVWPSTWTAGLDASAVSGLLGPRGSGVTLRGRSFSMTLDNEVDSSSKALGVSLEVVTSSGDTRTAFFGPFDKGRSLARTKAPFCANGCRVRNLLIGGPATTSATLKGTATVTGFTTDGKTVDRMLDASAWRPVISPLGSSPNATSLETGGTGLGIDLDSEGESGIGGLTPNDVPAYRPVLMGRSQDTEIEGGSGDRLVAKTDALDGLPIQPVADTESMPFLGPRGLVIDYTMMTRDQAIPEQATDVYVLARGDTPASVTAALRAGGYFDRTGLAATKDVLDQDAYALSLNLYLVAAIAAVALAFAGLAVNMAVQMPDRRRDAASMRVVGVRRPQILRAVFVEICAVLGAAGLAGVLAGSAAQYIVVRTVTLGFAGDIRTPRVVPTLDAARLGLLVGVVVAVLVGVATWVASLAVRRARAATLR